MLLLCGLLHSIYGLFNGFRLWQSIKTCHYVVVSVNSSYGHEGKLGEK